MPRILTAVLLVGGLVHAAITSPSGTSVLVSMRGPAGLNIEGTTRELGISELDGEILFRVPLSGIDTGIGLRNRHMRGYLDVASFPQAELRVLGAGSDQRVSQMRVEEAALGIEA